MQKTILAILFNLFLVNIYAQREEVKLKISHLTGAFYIYTTYNTYENSQVPAHGMYLVTNKDVVLFDTPWDTTQLQPLLDSINTKHNKSVGMCLVTHWHSDRTAGLDYYRQQGIKTYTSLYTDELSKKNNMKRAEYIFEKDTVFNIEQFSFETYYPGEGHTADNIIVWFNKEKILYGGCLIKGANAVNLGFLGDANVLKYEKTLKNVQKKCPDPKHIIVSHHDWNDINSLKNSIKLAKLIRKEAKGKK